jgi:hypothetical protein
VRSVIVVFEAGPLHGQRVQLPDSTTRWKLLRAPNLTYREMLERPIMEEIDEGFYTLTDRARVGEEGAVSIIFEWQGWISRTTPEPGHHFAV